MSKLTLETDVGSTIGIDGTLEVLPAEAATFNSEFSTVQRDLSMNYTAGVSIENGDEGRTAVMFPTTERRT